MRAKYLVKNFVCAVGAACLVETQAAWGQEIEARPSLRGGFHLGNDFNNNGSRSHLEGFEVGADLPLARKIKYLGGINFSPTLTLGGSNRSGADTDGNIYRFLVNVKYGIAGSGAYAGLGVGLGFTEARVHEFRNVSGFQSEFILGYNFRVAHPGQTQPFVEATYYDAEHNQMRGFSFNVGARF